MELLELTFSQECSLTYSPTEVTQTCDRAIYVDSQLAERSDT